MAKKVLNLNDMMEKWLSENLYKFSIEQIKSLRDNPDLLIVGTRINRCSRNPS